MVIEGKDIIIRKWQLDDASDMIEYAKSPNIGPNAGWKPHVDVKESESIIKMLMANDGEYAIVYKNNNKVIGGIKMTKSCIRHGVNAYELGYVLSEDYQKMGLVNQASKLLIQYTFQNLAAEIVEVYHYPHNFKSKRSIELLGFKYEGLMRNFRRNLLGVLNDGVCYSMTKDEYKKLVNEGVLI